MGRSSPLSVPAAALALSAAAAVGMGWAAAERGQSAAGDPRPNIVVVMTDDQHARSMRTMPKTRRLLARRGTTFARSYATVPLCCPSRATFLTGQYAHNHGVVANWPPAGGYQRLDGANTVPVWLRRAGYATAHVGKYLNGYGVPGGREMTRRRARREIPPGWSR